jgi:lycopene beta-cyclase
MIKLIGAGLFNSLLGLFLIENEVDFEIYESNIKNDFKTWSFQWTDVPEHLKDWIHPWCTKIWNAQTVIFPKYTRTLDSTYASIRSEFFRASVQKKLHDRFYHQAWNYNQKKQSDIIIDTTGKKPVIGGVQKFFGLDLEFQVDHGVSHPIVMDATIPQSDGYSFMYLLPFSEKNMLVELTHYTKNHALSVAMKQNIIGYAEAKFQKSFRVMREEFGVLPIPQKIDFITDMTPGYRLGMSGGFFHPTTGYSFGIALSAAYELAQVLTRRDNIRQWYLKKIYTISRWQKYYLLLNSLLFDAGEPQSYYKVFERFYLLPKDCIERFYSGTLSLFDKIRILIGKPPVSVIKAFWVVIQFSLRNFKKNSVKKRTYVY